MTAIKCPVCNKRVCDSDKSPQIAKLSNSNAAKADIVIKCKNCKSHLAIRILRSGTIKNSVKQRVITPNIQQLST